MDKYQTEAGEWLVECLGQETADSVKDRLDRFAEEFFKLCQCLHMPREDLIKLMDYVYERKVGRVNQEVGGTYFTFALLCNALKIDMQDAGSKELMSAWNKMDKVRAREALKPKNSPLPGTL